MPTKARSRKKKEQIEVIPEEAYWAVQTERSYARGLPENEKKTRYLLIPDIFARLMLFLPCLGKNQLKRLRNLCNEYLSPRKQAPDVLELAHRNVVGVGNPAGVRYRAKTLLTEAVGAKRFQLELRYCGKSCNGCPHGPYIFAYRYNRGSIRETYLGKNLSRLPPSLRAQFRDRIPKGRARSPRQLILDVCREREPKSLPRRSTDDVQVESSEENPLASGEATQ